jgi:hypothetical protein
MFARKIRVQYKNEPCPLKWLDNFSMRNFTNDAVFDDTVPVGDGLIEIGNRVPLPELKSAMEEWFRKKGYIGKEDGLDANELPFQEAGK